MQSLIPPHPGPYEHSRPSKGPANRTAIAPPHWFIAATEWNRKYSLAMNFRVGRLGSCVLSFLNRFFSVTGPRLWLNVASPFLLQCPLSTVDDSCAQGCALQLFHKNSASATYNRTLPKMPALEIGAAFARKWSHTHRRYCIRVYLLEMSSVKIVASSGPGELLAEVILFLELVLIRASSYLDSKKS